MTTAIGASVAHLNFITDNEACSRVAGKNVVALTTETAGAALT